MNLKEKFEKAKSMLAEIKAAFDKGEKTKEELSAAMKAVEDAKAALDAAAEAEKLMKSLEKEQETPAEKETEKPKAKSLGEAFAEHVKSSEINKKSFRVVAPEYKAATDVLKSPAGAVDFATTFDKKVVEAARTPLVVRDLFGAEQISGSTLVYLVEGAIEGAPAATNEGAKKPQVHFADPTPKTVSLAKIACHIKESDEYIDDFPFLASAVNGRLLYHLGLVEQNTLVSSLLGTSGILSDTTSWDGSSTATDIAELILKAAMDVQESSGFPADAIVMNPAIWYALRVAKNGDNDYYGGGFFGAQNIPNLWGIPVCVTTAVTDEQIIVGAFKTCGSVVSKGGVSVEATNTDQDDFVKNLMTIRAEERLALAVRRPAGFKKLVKDS